MNIRLPNDFVFSIPIEDVEMLVISKNVLQSTITVRFGDIVFTVPITEWSKAIAFVANVS